MKKCLLLALYQESVADLREGYGDLVAPSIGQAVGVEQAARAAASTMTASPVALINVIGVSLSAFSEPAPIVPVPQSGGIRLPAPKAIDDKTHALV